MARSYGFGWTVHLDTSPVGPAWTPPQYDAFWAAIGQLSDLIAAGVPAGVPTLRFADSPPENVYPGYYSRVLTTPRPAWMVNANGTTPRNAAEWADPTRDPYHDVPTCYVRAAPGVLDPVAVAHQAVHETFHLMMPYGLHAHTPAVGWIFTQDMTPVPGVAIVTPLAGQRLADSVWHLARGYRVVGSRLVVIPHLIAPGMPPPGPFPTVLPDFAPPTRGPVTPAAVPTP